MAIVDKKIEIQKSGFAMTSAISQLVYTCQISGQSEHPSGRKTVTHRKTDRNTDRQKHRNTHLNFMKIDILRIPKGVKLRK